MNKMPFFESGFSPRCTARIGELETLDDKKLRTAHWEPKAYPKGTVVLLHGRGEFIEKYEDVAQELTRREIRVLSMDWRGQGKSTRLLTKNPQRGFVRRFEDYVADLSRFMDRIVARRSEGKVFIMAHSMGALIALMYLTSRSPKLDGLVLCSPMADIFTTPVPRKAAQAMAAFACSAGFAEAYAFTQKDYSPAEQVFEGNPLTSDRVLFERMHDWLKREPDLRVGGATFGWLDASFRAIDTVRRSLENEELKRNKFPTLVLSSPDDRITPFLAQRRLTGMIPECTFKTYPGAGHEILMEAETIRTQVWKDIDEFFSLHIPSYIGGGTDRVRPDQNMSAKLQPPKPQTWRPGSPGAGRY